MFQGALVRNPLSVLSQVAPGARPAQGAEGPPGEQQNPEMRMQELLAGFLRRIR